MKSTLSIILILAASHSILAQQPTEPTKIEKYYFEQTFAVSYATGARYGTVSVRGAYYYDNEKKQFKQNFLSSTTTDKYYVTNKGVAEVSKPGDMRQGGSLKIGCHVQNYSFDGYHFAFDEQGRVTKVTTKTYVSYKGNYRKQKVEFQYEDEMLARVTVYSVMAEGKDASSAKPTFEFMTDDVKYEWKNGGKEVTVTAVNFKEKKKPSEQDQVYLTRSWTYEIDEKRNFEKEVTNGAEANTKEVLFEPAKPSVVKGSPGHGISERQVFTLDDKQVVVSETRENYKNGNVLDRRSEITYKYEFDNKPTDNVCNARVLSTVSIYDSAGNLIEERRLDGYSRRKDVNGQWGEWISSR
jgi:hypothetical protein